MHDYMCSINLGLLRLFLLFFYFCFLSTSQEIGWEEHLRNDLFCVACKTVTQSMNTDRVD